MSLSGIKKMATPKFALGSAVALTTFFTPVEPGSYARADFSGDVQEFLDTAVSQHPLRDYAEMGAGDVVVDGVAFLGLSFTFNVEPDPYGVRRPVMESFKVVGVDVPEPGSLMLLAAGSLLLRPSRKRGQADSKPLPSLHQSAVPSL